MGDPAAPIPAPAVDDPDRGTIGLIPRLAFTVGAMVGGACLPGQFASFDTLDTVSGVIATLLGFVIYALRHHGDTKADVAEEVEESVVARRTPLAWALHGPFPTPKRSTNVV